MHPNHWKSTLSLSPRACDHWDFVKIFENFQFSISEKKKFLKVFFRNFLFLIKTMLRLSSLPSSKPVSLPHTVLFLSRAVPKNGKSPKSIGSYLETLCIGYTDPGQAKPGKLRKFARCARRYRATESVWGLYIII